MLSKQYKINLLRQNLIHHKKAGDINMSNFKSYFVVKKNSGILGRVAAILHLEINVTPGIISLKNVISIDRNIKRVWKMRIFLLIASYYRKKIRMITTESKKQTP